MHPRRRGDRDDRGNRRVGAGDGVFRSGELASKHQPRRNPLEIKAACIDMQLVQERDGRHQLPASTVFAEPEIETLEALVPTLEGKTERSEKPAPDSKPRPCSWVIARLGGWNCYYKPPGPITFRRGMERFHAIHRGRPLESKLE
jgi:hypothetical protein